MEKIKTWRRFALATLALLLTAVLSFALVQIIPSKADEELVLDGNTAKFTVENDMTTVNSDEDTRWTYSRETNEWTSTQKKNYKGNLKTVLKLTVTSDGDMVFRWKYNVSNRNTLNVTKQIGEEGEPETVLTVSDSQASYLQYSEPVSIQGLHVGDIVEISYSNSSTANSYCVTIQGLQFPANVFSITAKVDKDSIGGGTFKTDKDNEIPNESGELTIQRGYDEGVAFTAVPKEGYAVYWQDAKGNVVSPDKNYTISHITQTDETMDYTVFFVERAKFGFTSSQKEDGISYWKEKDRNDKFRTLDFSVFKVGDTATLYYDIEIPSGGAYLSLDYIFNVKERPLYPKLTLNGVAVDNRIPGSPTAVTFSALNTDYDVHDTATTSKFVDFIETEGYYRVAFTVGMGSWGEFTPDDTTELTVGNIKVCQHDELVFADVSFAFDTENFSATVKYEGHDPITVPENLTAKFPIGMPVEINVQTTCSTKPSRIDPSCTVKYYFNELISDIQESGEAWRDDPETSSSWGKLTNRGITITAYNQKYLKFGAHTDQFGEEGKINLKATSFEDAPMPIVSVSKTANEETTESSVDPNEIIEFPFGGENSLFVKFKKFDGFEDTDFKVTINDVPTAIFDAGDGYSFMVSDVANAKISIGYALQNNFLDTKNSSDGLSFGTADGQTPIAFSFQAIETIEGGLESILKTEFLTVENDQTIRNDASEPKYDSRWTFDPVHSEEGSYAFIAGSSVDVSSASAMSTYSSAISFKMTEAASASAGVISFDFMIDGDYADFMGMGDINGAYAFYTFSDTPLESFDINGLGTCMGPVGERVPNSDWEGATLIAKVSAPYPDCTVETGKGVTKQSNDWYRFSTTIQSNQTIYVGFVSRNGGFQAFTRDSMFVIKDVQLYVGRASLTVEKNADSTGTVTSTIGDDTRKESSQKETFSSNAGELATLTATPGANEIFYGWSVNGKLYSTEQTISFNLEGDTEVVAYMAEQDFFEARIDGDFKHGLSDALSEAGKDRTVYLLKSVALSGTHTIAAGASLVIPYNGAGDYFTYVSNTTTNQTRIAWADNGLATKNKFLTLTLKEGASLTVNGSLFVGGVLNNAGQGYQGHTSGAYSELILETGSKIQVAKGGVFDVYGRVWGGEGKTGADMGTIDVAEGGKLYQPFLILDYAGGSNTAGLYFANVTPFNRYAMINIEVPFTVHYGAQLIGHASLWIANFSSFVGMDQPFISYDMGQDATGKKLGGDGKGHDTFIMLKKDAFVTVTYDGTKVVEKSVNNCTEGIGQTTMKFTGGAEFSYMLFSAMGFSVPTGSVYFAIPYNFQIEMDGAGADYAAQYEAKTDFKLMPGSSVKVGKGATLTLNANVYVYDGLIQGDMSGKSYPTEEQLTQAGYKTNAQFIVDGKLVIGNSTPMSGLTIGSSSGVDTSTRPATFFGVVQTTGNTGIIIVPQNATLKGKIIDGTNTSYDCNYVEYESSMRLYDKVHKVLTSVPTNVDGKAEKAMTFTATWASDDAVWKLENIKIKSCTAEGVHEDGAHTLTEAFLSPVTGMVGSWMVDHEAHSFDWSQLSGEEKDLKGEKYKDLHRQCTELGCADEEHKLLLSEGFTLKDTYKGSAFSAEDLEKLFYKYYFGSETVPAELADCDFSASVNTGSAGTIQNANDYASLTVTLTNGFFGDVNKTSETFTFTVEKFNVANLDQAAIKESLSGLVYNGTAQTPELTLRADGLTGAVEHELFVWANNTNAGVNTASVTIKGSGTNFTGELTVNFSIAKAELTVEVVGKTKPYDGTAWSDVEAAVKGTDFNVTDGEIYNSDDLGLKLTVESAGADVGSYTVKGEASNPNYTVTVTEGAYTITRAALTVTIESKSHTYGETPKELSYTLGGVVGEEESDIKTLITLQSDGAQQWADAAKYNITAWYNGSEIEGALEATNADVLKNYTVTVSGGTNAYTVEKKSIEGATFTVTTAYTYDGKEKEPTMSEIGVTLEGYDGDHKVTFTVGDYKNNTDATTDGASLVVTGTGNFTGTKTVNFKIEKATVDNITVNGEYAYNGEDQTDSVKSKIVVKSGELTLNAGEYTVTFAKSEESTVKNAGTYTVTVTLTEACKNYQLGEVTTATFKVAKAKVTVKANDQTTPQNEQILKEFTYTVSGGTFFNDDEAEIKLHFQYTTEAVSDTVKDFDIIIGWQEGYTCDNYDVIFEKGTYHIIDAIFKNVTVTGDGQITYNGQSHTLTVEVNNEALAGKTTVTITKDGETFEGATNAGTYSIHVNIKATGYQTEYNADFTLTITPIKVTVTFDAKSSTYGDAVKTETELTYTMPEDVLPKDQDTFKAAIHPTTNAESKSAVSGKYKITAEKPELQNYDVTIVDGVYTITARPVEVTVNKQSVTYNRKQQSARSRNGTDWSVTDLASGEEATVLNVKFEATGENAGSYDITASWNNTNYAVTFKGAEGLTVEGDKVKNAFVIEAAALTEATVTGSYTYNGQAQTPTFTVKATGGLTVEEGGFELEFAADADRVSAGTVQVTVKAKSANYSGEVKTQFTIAQKKIKVTLTAQSFEYSGKVPTPDSKAYTVEEGGLCSRNGKEDDLGITITLVDGNKNVGSYSLEAEASNTDYEVTFDKTQKLNITKKHITVKADDLTSTYGDAIEELTYTAKGLVEGEDPETELHITLQPERTIKEAGTYTVTGTGSATNYAFDGVEEGTYTVEKREVTVKINDQSALYDGTEPSVLQGQGEDAGWTIVSGDIVGGDNLHIVLTKAEGVDADKYAISGAFENDNYEVTFEGTMETAGTYTVKPRAVTVEIHNQSATYDFTLAGTNGYSFNGAAWTVEAESLAPGEEKTVLGVTLTKPAMSDAGIYAITGSATNTNYVVTFVGEYAGEDENAGKAGVYTVMKKDLSEEALFVLFVGKDGDEGEMDGDRTVRAKFSGDPLSLAGSATITEGDERRALEVTSDPATIEKIGDHTVTLTIVDKNYQGKTEFLVIVTDANGYTEKLLKTLDDLEKLVAGLDIDRLTADDYAKLVEIYNALAALSDEERETGAEKLAAYQAYVDAWDNLADIDDVVETAQAVANAPIEALFEAAAVLTALAGLAYIALKGGLL